MIGVQFKISSNIRKSISKTFVRIKKKYFFSPHTITDTETARYRLCDNPPRYGSGPACPGISTESDTCTTECPGEFINLNILITNLDTAY